MPWGVPQELAESLRPLLAVSPGAVICGVTAARLWGLALPARLLDDPRLHLATVGTNNPVRRFGVCGHRLKLTPEEVRWRDGLPVTAPERTWLDLAPKLTEDELIALGDELVCEHRRSFGPVRQALASADRLKAVVGAHPGNRGVLRARAALELIRVGADSPPETHLRLALIRAGLPEPELNAVIRDARGAECAWPDLAYSRYRISVQYDGAHHRTAAQQASDAERDYATARAGWESILVTKHLLGDYFPGSEGFAPAVARIREALIRRGWHR